MSRMIAPDAFWDGRTGGGVRCSSMGDDANRYHDPAQHFCEGNGGRSVATMLPSGSNGLRGVVIPRAMPLGGSRGFDPNKPRLMNIDPDIDGQACVVDLSKITKENMAEAFAKAAENPLVQGDMRLLAAQTFHNLAVGYEPVGMGSSRGPRLINRQPPVGGFGYVVPKASLGGGQITDEPQMDTEPFAPQEVMSPSVTPRAPVAPSQRVIKQALASRPAQEPEYNVGTYQGPTTTDGWVEDEEPMESIKQPAPPMFKDQSKAPMRNPLNPALPVKNTQNSISAPGTSVIFEMKGWGSFEAAYHEVIRNDNLLVLSYDTRFKSGMRFTPPTTEDLMAVRIGDSKEVFFVHSTGSKFNHNNFDYCILIIDQAGQIEEDA